jgi:low affinity Fe/Cu permease
VRRDPAVGGVGDRGTSYLVERTIPSRTPTSRAVHRLDAAVAHSAAAGVVAVGVVVFLVMLAIAGFPQSWAVWFSTVAAAITLVMVFVVQHTQRREQATTQLKLDELINALPDADDRFVRVEIADDDEIQELERRKIEQHRATRAG